MPIFVSSRGFPYGMFFVTSRKFPYGSLPNFKGPPWAANLTSSLRVMRFEGTSLSIPIAAYDIAWSSDGKRLAYSTFSGKQNSTLYVSEMQGEQVETSRRALTDQTLNAHGPAWSADGSPIAFTGLWKDSSQIFVIGADGVNLMQLSNNPRLSCYHVSWSPDGNWIVADCRKNETEMAPLTYELGALNNIFLFDVRKPGAKPRQLTKCAILTSALPPPTCGAHNPSFAPAQMAAP